MKEAHRYLSNARETLRKVRREGALYTDVKPVREACATAYLAALYAIDEFLLAKGFTKKELPKSTDGYRDALHKYISARNDRLLMEFERVYDLLHIAGYYRGLLRGVPEVREAMSAVERFIHRLD